MLSLRTLTAADIDSADTIIRSTLSLVHCQKKMLRYNLLLQPEGWILALLDSVPVGLVGVMNYGSFASIELLLVLPIEQQQQVRAALMEQVLIQLAQKDCVTIFSDVPEADTAWYKSFGFKVDETILYWYRDAVSLPDLLFAHSSSTVFRLQRKDIPALTAFDARCLGAGRATLFALLLLEFPERVFVTRDVSGRISGYLFVQEQRVGPWVARTVEDAEVLLRFSLALPFNGGPFVFTPGTNMYVTRLLAHYGFIQQRVLLRMLRGEPLLLHDRSQLYGQANFNPDQTLS